MSVDSLRLMGRQVGARLRDARLARKYTQSQLARPDFSVSYISAIERGQIQPSLRALEILAGKLDIHATDLLPESRSPVAEASAPEQHAQKEGLCEIALLEAQIALHQGRPGQAIALLRDVAVWKDELRRESLYQVLLGQAYLESGAEQESELLLAGASHDTADPLYARIIEVQISAYTAMRNTEQAAQLQQIALAYLEHRQSPPINPVFGARLFCSMAQYHSQLGQFARAAALFDQALHTLQVWGTGQQQRSVCQQLAQSYQEQGHDGLAALYQQRCVQLDLQARLCRLRSDIQHVLGRMVLKRESAEAYASLQARSQEARAMRDPLAQASANVHLASWFLAHGEDAQAEQHIREAQRQANPAGETCIAADVQFVLGELTDRRRDYAAADRYIETGLAMLERLGAGEELIERLAQYARRLEERGLTSRAIVYWRRAYEKREKGWPAAF